MNQIGLSGPYGENFLSGESYGASAFNRARPKIEGVDLAMVLGEAREIPQMLKTTAKAFSDIWKGLGGSTTSVLMQPKKIADNFLNHQFGWVPFLGDMFRLYQTYTDSDKKIAQIERDNGQWVKRKRFIERLETSVFRNRSYLALVNPSLNGTLYAKRTLDGINNIQGFSDFHTQTMSRVWFEASFKYYLPQFDKSKHWNNSRYGEAMRLMSLYGLRVTPSTVYNLIPWSWLVDWFSNTGDVVDNIVASQYDNLVSKYAYVMKQTVRAVTNTSHVFLSGYGDTHDIWTQYILTKSRSESGSPFGWNLQMGDLSLRQLSILAALGLTRQ
jgi:hypothetical protein